MLNNVTLMGRLVKDPELKTIGSGTSVASFTIACDREYSGKDGERQTDFFDCTAWRGTADFISKYFAKGRMIAVTGKLQTRTYEAKDGTNRKITEIVVDTASFCGDKGNAAAPATSSSKKSFDADPEELPF